MAGPLKRALAVLGPRGAPRALDGFVDSLVQSFENCRDGLSDDAIRRGEARAYFLARYEPERARLSDVLRLENPLLEEAALSALFERVDRLMRDVLIPGYVRLSASYTGAERNGFYDTPPRFHALERVGFAIVGALCGYFVVEAPFIPLWSKEWILPFFLAGLVYPELRRLFHVRRYGLALNRMVARTDAEIERIDVSYLLHPLPQAREGAEEGGEAWLRSQAENGQKTR